MIYSLNNNNNEDQNYINYRREAMIREANIRKQILTDAAANFIANNDLEDDQIEDIMNDLELFDCAIQDTQNHTSTSQDLDRAAIILSSLHFDIVDAIDMDPNYM